MKRAAEFDLHAIEVFVLSVELGGMTIAAQHLRVTQSAVSQTIAKLEHGLGAPLFDRSLRPMALTTTGKALFERGQALLANARLIYDEVRQGADLPIGEVTIGMSESLAVQLTAPLLRGYGDRVSRWKISSGISAVQHEDFLARRYDMLVTGSNRLEPMEGIDHHSIVVDPFVLIFPADYRGPIATLDVITALPFIRYSLGSGMGQRIERQLARMKARLPNVIEVDMTHQQLSTVAQGLGWSITSLLCIAAQPALMAALRVEPIPDAPFARRVQIVSRSGELGSLPQDMATLARDVLRRETFPPIVEAYPWVAEQIEWPKARVGG